MVDFSALGRKPAGEAKKPPALPAGDYPGVIKSWEWGDQNKNKTPYVRFHLGLTAWPDTVEADAKDGIDLSKRQLRRDYYYTDDALWRLDDLIRSLGIEPAGRTYEEVLPETTNAQVLVEVQQYLNQRNNETANQVGDIKVVG